ncbi:MAG TPA: hypothetical protein VER96_19845 [Polyangiaceae bacterium]|nr:hypothetical protein [Polyangiaceae bacterium]
MDHPKPVIRGNIHAKDYGGIMVWELGQDVSGADSLFSVIKKNR